MPQSPTAPESLEPSDAPVHEFLIREFLGEFCCTPLTPEQVLRYEEKSDFGKEARGIGFQNWNVRGLQYTDSLDALALVRAKMNPQQRARFSRLLAKAVLPVAFHQSLVLREGEAFKLIDAPASLQARIAYEVLNSDTSNEGKLYLAREDREHLETRESLGLPPARRL